MNRTLLDAARTSGVVLCALLASVFIGTLLHEFGHGLTALMLGGQLHEVSVWPGVTVYPDLRFDDWHWTFFGLCNWSDVPSEWKEGLSILMGSGTTALAAYALLAAVHGFRKRCWLAVGLLAASLPLSWDILLYSTMPLLGLRHGIIVGGPNPEPLIGAEMMGIPRSLYFALLAIHFVVFHFFLVTVSRAVVRESALFSGRKG